MQDRELRELKDWTARHEAEEFEHHGKVERQLAQFDAKLDKFFFGSRLIKWFAGVFASLILLGIGGYQANLDTRIQELERRADDIAERQNAWEPMATRWGNSLEDKISRLDKSIDELKEDVKELRRGK